MSIKPHVGIIGAGLSGLRCADILIRNGARVTILEARNRIGGRVCFSWMHKDGNCQCLRLSFLNMMANL